MPKGIPKHLYLKELSNEAILCFSEAHARAACLPKLIAELLAYLDGHKGDPSYAASLAHEAHMINDRLHEFIYRRQELINLKEANKKNKKTKGT